MEKFNIAKYVAYCGICSRRDAEEMVLDGRIRVNGAVERDLTRDVDSCDAVTINGMNINFIDEIKLYMFHKPKECIVSKSDDRGRKTIFDLLPKSLPRLIAVGRLDFQSEGLILLTNYGPLARHFELPQTGMERVYELKIFGTWREDIVKYLRDGVKIDGVQYRPIKLKVLGQRDKQIKVQCILTEGKNLELRKIFQHFGFLVSKLKRVSYGYFHLGQIPTAGILECKKFVIDRAMKEAKLSK